MLELAYFTLRGVMSAYPELRELSGWSAVGAEERGLRSTVHADTSLPALDLFKGHLTSVFIEVLCAFSGHFLCPDEVVSGFRLCSRGSIVVLW